MANVVLQVIKSYFISFIPEAFFSLVIKKYAGQ